MGAGMVESGAVMPERIGRYRIVRPLSKGGMALVYEARKESLGGVAPRVAVKVILPDYAASSTFRELFINEARLGAAMQHQNLVQILDFDSDGDRYFLVMEYVEGLTLSKMIGIAARHDIKVPMQVIFEIGRQACEGLHYAHQAVDGKGRALNMIHRDIKPSNLILNEEGGVKILDFGISKGRLRHERSGSVKGTWGYMAPEQASGERIGPNADVFGLGIVLYEMGSRRSMFKGRKEEEIRQLLLADHAARSASTLDPSYAPLAKVLTRALHRDPKQRFATAAELGRHLADLLPDPITVREEMVRFYRAIHEIHQREAPGRTRPDDSELSAQSARLAPRFTLDATRAVDQPWPLVVGVIVLVVGAAFVFGHLLTDLLPTGEPPELAERPVPVEAAQELAGAVPPDQEAARSAEPRSRVVRPDHVRPDAVRPDAVRPDAVRPDDTRPDAVQPDDIRPDAVLSGEPIDAGVGSDAVRPGPGEGVLVLDAVQEAEIFVDGRLLRPPYGEPRVFPVGKHVITMVDANNQRVSQVVELAEGGRSAYVWDFERWDWRQ